MLPEVARLVIPTAVPVLEAHLAEAAVIMEASALIDHQVLVVAGVQLSVTLEVLVLARLVVVELVQVDPCAQEAAAFLEDKLMYE